MIGTIQGESAQSITRFTMGVLAGFPATAAMLLVIYIGIKHSVHLVLAILSGIVVWGLFLIIQRIIKGEFIS
jgi:hypothetical protein